MEEEEREGDYMLKASPCARGKVSVEERKNSREASKKMGYNSSKLPLLLDD